ncbi:hypothetical protein F4678DRAFT_473259 [Xylaria arbuscula]|nr:hypothetical protein F4678DRAFT_473259 [Xylaria arbuscula]
MVSISALAGAGTLSERWGFKRHWRSAKYHTGDIYQDYLQENRRKDWGISPEDAGLYLRYLQINSPEWPQLRFLADFMEVGTDPLRWRNFHGDDKNNVYTYPDDRQHREEKQRDRVRKTHVRQLEYLSNGTVKLVGNYTTPEELTDALESSQTMKGVEELAGIHAKLKLFVVEDLSREVIERLGYHFDIDPDFFRAHILDFAWFNIRDPFWDPPTLHMNAIRKDWYQIRFCRARYFTSQAMFTEGQDAANRFNIGRKLYEDENKAYWDTTIPRPLVKPKHVPCHGLVDHLKGWFGARERSEKGNKSPDVEASRYSPVESSNRNEPSVDGKLEQLGKERIDGNVGLMRTRATFWKKKGVEGGCDFGVLLLDPTIDEGFPLWRGYRNWDPIPSTRGRESQTNSCVPSLTRSSNRPKRPKVFSWHSPILESDVRDTPTLALLSLVCSEWLTLSEYIKTRLSQVDWEITHPNEFLSQSKIDIILNKLHNWRRLVPLYREMLSETKSKVLYDSSSSFLASDAINTYKLEFDLVLGQMEEYEERIDRLTAVVMSSISILDSRRVEHLTLLGTLFVPLSLVGTVFSMSDNLAGMGATFGYWAATSLFLLLLALLLWNSRGKSYVRGE